MGGGRGALRSHSEVSPFRHTWNTGAYLVSLVPAMIPTILHLLVSALATFAYTEQAILDDSAPPSSEAWLTKYGAQIDQPFSGPLSFSHLPYNRCLEQEGLPLGVALLGIPFDTAVTYRPGARFGPHAIRAGSRRQRALRGWTVAWGANPYTMGTDIMDCG
jgi:agmatinase